MLWGWWLRLLAWVGLRARPTLLVTLGPPGSGKSTVVDRWRAKDPTRRARLARDGVRAALGAGGDREVNPPEVEEIVTIGQHAAVVAWLRAGLAVAADDTALGGLEVWQRVAWRGGGRLVVVDCRATPVEECIRRDAARGAAGGRLVGERAIRRVAARCAAVVVPAGVEVVAAEALAVA
jgi:hypothetical protein